MMPHVPEIDKDFQLPSYDFSLPSDLVATRPASPRDRSQLMVYRLGEREARHTQFFRLLEYLPSPSLALLVFNQSKVFPCRLLGKRSTGGACELFLLSREENPICRTHLALIRSKQKGKKKQGDRYFFPEGLEARIVAVRGNGQFEVQLNLDSPEALASYLERWGKVPLPPYIRKGESDERDRGDYQTVFARDVGIGSVAAPTAGLHFTHQLLEQLQQGGVEFAKVSLHVGLGTFAPVKTQDIRNHTMHTEYFSVDAEHARRIREAQRKRKKIIAVGTTSLRVLQSSLDEKGQFAFWPGQERVTNLFIHPGVSVSPSVDGLITNFHWPQSSLLMLVSSLVGREKLLQLYGEAIERRYRFFSYGDAMLILK